MAKKKRKSPTSRAVEELRRLGFEPTIVEQRLPHCFVTRDAWNWCDIIAMNGVNTLGIQVTSGGGSKGESNRNARRVKILAEPRALLWIQSGNLLEIWNYLPETDTFHREEIVAGDFA